jgi:hypothetical protein
VSWWNTKLFKFNRKPARRRPVRRTPHLAVRELESRLTPSVTVSSYLYGLTSDGVNTNETVLTPSPSNVNSTDFGKLFATSVDGQVYAQPLYIPGVQISSGPAQGVHNAVYVATQHDSLYAIDAQNGSVLWKDSFLTGPYLPAGAVVTTVPNSDVGSSDINPEIGITSTPVIDTTTNTLYLTAKTKEVYGGNTHYVYRLHAIDITNGNEKFGGPVVIADTISNDLSTYTYVRGPSVAGTGDGNVSGVITFNALRQMQRAAITLINGTIFLGFASHGDNDPYHGWVLGYNASTLQLNAVFNTSPNGSRAGIWQGGGRLAAEMDSNGHVDLYFETGNGTFDTTLNSAGLPINGDYGDSFVKIQTDNSTAKNPNINGWGLHVADYFTPYNEADLNSHDEDLGSGAPILLPASAGTTAHPNLLIGSGKQGTIYVIDRDNMGHFNSSSDSVVQEVTGTFQGSLDTPAFFNNTLYYVPGYNNDTAKTYSWTNGVLSSSPTSTSPDTFGFPGSTPAISADGTSNGIVWDLDRGSNELRAYAASSFGTELYTSAQAANGRDTLGAVVKFAVAIEADAQVLVGTSSALVVYGLLPTANSAPAAPTHLQATYAGPNAVNLAWGNNAVEPNLPTGFDVEESTDGGATFTSIATTNGFATAFTVYGLNAGTAYTFRVRAVNSIGDSAYSNNATSVTLPATTSGGLNFAGGFTGETSLTLNGASAKLNGSALQLTDNNTNEAASAFGTSAVDVTHFATAFSFQITNGTNPSADGFTFCIQTVGATALGASGGSLGYGGIANSVAVKFDLYDNAGEGTDSTGLFTGGASPTEPGSIDLTPSGINLHSGDVFDVGMTYDGKTLQMTMSDKTTNCSTNESYPINIPAIVGAGKAYVGFTGGTGGLTAFQDILTWTYTPITKPAAPTDLTAIVTAAKQITLSWADSSNNETGFVIQRATNANFTANLVTLHAPPNATATATFVNSHLAKGTTYYYRVRAVDLAGGSAWSNVAGATTPSSAATAAPAKPTNAKSSNVTATSVTISWTDNANNEDGFVIYRQTGVGAFVAIATVPADTNPAPSTVSFTDTTVAPSTRYTYRIKAYNLKGYSTFTEVTVAMPAASGIGDTDGGEPLL